MASLSPSRAPCRLGSQLWQSRWNSVACTQNCKEMLSRFSRFYRHFTLSSISWNLSGFHPILQGLFMPFTFHVYVKCINSPWDKAWNAGLRSVPPLLVYVQDPFSANGKAFSFPWERKLRTLQKPWSRILLLWDLCCSQPLATVRNRSSHPFLLASLVFPTTCTSKYPYPYCRQVDTYTMVWTF